jgi:hypothetical protein
MWQCKEANSDQSSRSAHVAEITTVESRVVLVREALVIDRRPLYMFDVAFFDSLGVSGKLMKVPRVAR